MSGASYPQGCNCEDLKMAIEDLTLRIEKLEAREERRRKLSKTFALGLEKIRGKNED